MIPQIIGLENEKNKISEELNHVKEELQTCNEGNIAVAYMQV